MNPYCFIIEVEPQHGNPLGAHAARAIVHIWVFSTDIKTARDTTFAFLKADLWEVLEEKDAFEPTQEKINGLDEAAATSYRTAEAEGIHATYNYWHKG